MSLCHFCAEKSFVYSFLEYFVTFIVSIAIRYGLN